MAQDEFTKLFKYMNSRFDSIDSKLQKQATKEDTKKIMSAQIVQLRIKKYLMMKDQLWAINWIG